MNRKIFHTLSGAAMLLSLAGCSSSEVEGDSALGGDELPELTEASTDAVPAEGGAENLEAPTDDLAMPSEGEPVAPPATDMAEASGEPPAADLAAAPPAEAAPPSDLPDPSAGLAAAPPVETTPPAESTDSGASSAVATRSSGGSRNFESYSVQGGDTLMKIAFEVYGDLYRWREIYEANRDKIGNPNAVPTGTELKIEKPASPVSISRNGEQYTIKQGDTLGTISQDVYGTRTKWRKIYNNNRELIKNPNRIFAGFTLYYTMDEEDRRQMETPQPLAAAEPAVDTSRMPASIPDATAPVPAVQQMPGAATAEIPPPAAMAPQGMAPAPADAPMAQ